MTLCYNTVERKEMAMYTRNQTRPVYIKDLQIGKQNKIIIQSMTNTKTKDIDATVLQIRELQMAGCQMVRLAVLDLQDAQAIKAIKAEVSLPLVADIHFDHRLALAAIESGVDKIRINPGNIGSIEKVKAVVLACQAKQIPIRIGINSGSLPTDLLVNDQPTADAMIESARRHLAILESLNFKDIVLSFKSSDVLLTIAAYQQAASLFPYPLHLGVTEAGTLLTSAIKSSAALGTLIHQGIGDTIRVSISDDPVKEMAVAKQLLRAFNLYDDVANLISCPTCGRLQYDMLPLAQSVEKLLETIPADIDVAVMGCAVNGPQEARRADFGVIGGHKEGLLLKKGTIIRRVPQAELLSALKEEIEKYLLENNHSITKP